MTFIVLKSFLPEFFLSFCLLSQLVYNSLIVSNYKQSFPIVTKELFLQTLFVLSAVLLLLLNLKCEAFFSNFLFVNDQSTILVKSFTVLTGIIILLIIVKNIGLQKLNFFEYFLLYLLSLLAILLLITASDMLAAYLVIEMQALCFYVLTSFNRDSAFSTEAGLKYFISGSFVSGIFLAGCSLIYGLVGTLNFAHLYLLFSTPFETASYFYVYLFIGNFLILITFLFKLAVVPFHFWAPDVYEGAPLSSTIVFSILPKVGLVYFFIKWLLLLTTSFTDIFVFLEITALLSLILGIVFSLRQKRLKRLMVYSSIAQLGFVIAALAAPGLNTLVSSFFFLFIYVVSSLVFWLNLSTFYGFQQRVRMFFQGTLSPLYLTSFTNLFLLNKPWSFSLLVLFFSIAGIPPFGGFFAKVFIVASLMESHYVMLGLVILLMSLVSSFYYLRFLKVIFFEPQAFIFKNSTSQVLFFDTFFLGNCFINSIFIFVLLYVFINPTFVLLVCQQIILGLYFF